MLDIYSRDRKKLAVLQNAIDVTEYERLNQVSELTFSLPTIDDKTRHCRPFNLLRWNDGQAYRLLDTTTESRGETDLVTYNAEHVIATLIDDVIFGTWEQLNLPTRTVLEHILDRQSTKHWVLGDCEFTRYFSYSWSNENLLAALFSVANRFDEEHQWVFDTSVYPWVVHLRKLEQSIDPQYYIREQRNLLFSLATSRGRMIYNRIYPLGYGEGVNQLNIREVNGGVPYVENKESIEKYGLHTTIWEDLRFENAEAMLQRAKVLLSGYANPYDTYEISVADLEKLTSREIDRAAAGKIVQFGDVKTYIVEVQRHPQLAGQDRLTIANQPEDIAGTISELANRNRINSVYANGATNIYAQSMNDNADADHPAVLKFYIPSEARQINKVLLTWETERFRAYETGAESTSTVSRSTSSGGQSTRTSSSGGGGSTTSGSGGGSHTSSGSSSRFTTGQTPSMVYDRKTSEQHGSGSAHYHVLENFYDMKQHKHDMDHTHSISIPSHQHTVSVPSHTHSVDIPSHTHSVDIPGHTHKIIYGIYEGPRASDVKIRVDGKEFPLEEYQREIDVADYLAVESGSGKIRRGTYHTVEIVPISTPNNPKALTRIAAAVTVQLFIQSQGGGNY